jgi:ATP-dependent Clp protease ATP-binding subunit ClpA
MNIFVDGKLDPQVFDSDILQGTNGLNDVLLAVNSTRSAVVESTHFLIAISGIRGGFVKKFLDQHGLTVAIWESGLLNCDVEEPAEGLPPGALEEEVFHESARDMLDEASKLCGMYGFHRISEGVLLWSALKHATAHVRALLDGANIDVQTWCEEVEALIKPVEAVQVFEKDEKGTIGAVMLASFSPSGKKILSLLQTETESLGYNQAGPRHLLLALLVYEGGVTQYGLHHQGLSPRKIQQAVMLSLRNRAKQQRSTVPLAGKHFQILLQDNLIFSGELAGRDRSEQITEAHILRAFLSIESTARRILEDEQVNIADLARVAERYDVQDEEKEEEGIAAIETVEKRLKQRLVGQDEAIERILPYIQRMRFGFKTPGRPVGVFLFCGPSGSGKTEMAKEIARAVYGSEENLIFLEMGQFCTEHSINIFVGAPPGYVGYGEGKLTNGLRDKPQAVVLFDEVEKAHPRVSDALLRFLDEGQIDDPAGSIRDGSQCIIILTSNAGAEQLSQLWDEIKDNPNWQAIVRERLREVFRNEAVQQPGVGGSPYILSSEPDVTAHVGRERFRPEFINRIDELILFRTLQEADYVEIARRLLERDLERLRQEHAIDVTLDDGVTTAIGKYCKEINEGARVAQRLTQSVVITPVIDFVQRRARARSTRLLVRAECETDAANCMPKGNVEVVEE